jgi:hypothetical protein
LYLGMVMLDVVFNWEARRVVDSHVAPESKKNARDLKRQQFRVRSKAMLLDIGGPIVKKPQMYWDDRWTYRLRRLPKRTSTRNRSLVRSMS